MEEQRIMADQRAFGNTDRSPAEVGAQVRDRAQEAGTQVRDRVQEVGAQVRDKAQEVGAQVRDKAQEASRQVAETASEYYQQGRQQMEAVEHTLADGIRAKPLPSVLMAAGTGMLLTLLWKKEHTDADYYRQGRQKAEDYYRQGRHQAEDYYRQGRQQAAAVAHTLEDAMQTKPLQSLLMAAGAGMLLTLLLKK
jgi:ElaB/YqjD/DUF883 family membrane-anchored ribosome-binding protein